MVDEGRLVKYGRVWVADLVPVDVDSSLLLLSYEEFLVADLALRVFREVVEAEGALHLSIDANIKVFGEVESVTRLELNDIRIEAVVPRHPLEVRPTWLCILR